MIQIARSFLWPILAAILLSAMARPVRAQQSSGGQTLRIGSEEVLLDVIVRDRKGRPIRDLKPEEIEIAEDGVKQAISSFRLIEFEGGAIDPESKPNSTTNPADNYPVDPSRQLNLVTMVFDNLDNNGRRLARDAALDFVNNGMRSNVLVAVFVVDNRFYVLQPFTNNREKLRKAIDAATGRAERQFSELSKQIVQQMEIIANAADFGPPASAPAQAQTTASPQAASGMQSLGLTPTGAGAGGSGVDKAMAQITLSTLRAIESAQVDQRARASIYTFLHIAREQRRLTGRKTVLYFSNGLQVSANLADALRTAISEANLANVSFYAVDARGLNMEIESERAKLEMAQAIKASRDSISINGAPDRSALLSADFAENSLRMNKQGTLAELAESTGGSLIANTNDLRKPLRQVASELSSYYALAYVPASHEPDGKFHNITVKVARRDAHVQSRNGYFAVPAMDGKPVMAYEMPMLAAVNKTNAPRDFTHRAGLLRFAPDAPQSQHTLLVEVPLAEIAFKTDRAKKQYSAHLAVLALVRNEKNEVVQRVSQDYPVQGKLERLESLKKGNLDFTQAFALAPGNYTLVTAVHDFEAQKTSVARGAFAVPSVSPELAISSIALIKRLDPAGMATPSDDKPLLTPQGRVIPFLGGTVSADKDGYLSFYFTIYLPAGAAGKKESPGFTLEFLRDGAVASRGTMTLPAPDDRGRIAHVVSVPAKGLRSGAYEVRAAVNFGQAQVEEKTSFHFNNPYFVESAETIALTSPAAAAAPIAEPVEPAIAVPAPLATFGISETAQAISRSKIAAATGEIRAATVNVQELLREVEANGAALHRRLLNFTYQHRKVLHHLDDAGRAVKEEFQDYEAYPVAGRHVLVKVAANGKPLPQWEIESERQRAGEALARAEQQRDDAQAAEQGIGYVTAAVTSATRGKGVGLVIDPVAFLRACEFTDPRMEMLEGREMIALDFAPVPGADLPMMKRYVQRLLGTIWVDAVDRMIVRIEARNLVPGLGKNGKPLPESPEPKLVYQQMRLPSGDWAPRLIRVNAAGDGSAFFGLNVDAVFEFKDFKQFNTTGEETKIFAPEKKP